MEFCFTCPVCNGEGVVIQSMKNADTTIPCKTCKRSGELIINAKTQKDAKKNYDMLKNLLKGKENF